ncbi:tyrosine recombinase XerS [Peribacillus asahii]|uniref:tyrosine recombinase XerS n=1 Tax=Peribacillus asahii TaxID=228899 RepID=UPI00207ADCE0|nr:tyrosine recombinase XerS [Peribacillus asahii]USK62441.1 tyrosine recombinase XerS [Peribacillus asahii]
MIHEKRLETHLTEMPDYVIEYIRSKKRAKYSASTLLGYVHEYMKLFNWLQQEGISKTEHIRDTSLSVLETLTKKNAEFYKEFLEEENIATEKEKRQGIIKKRSENAVARNINAIKSLFNYLTTETEDEESGECYFYRNVFSKIKVFKKDETANRRAKKISSIILTTQEINEFLTYLKDGYEHSLEARQKSSFIRDKERDIALISMMLGSGARVSEIASLTLKDINFQKKQLDIIRKGNKADTVEVLPSALQDLKTYLRIRDLRYPGAGETPYVFLTKYAGSSRPISVRAIQNLVTKYTAAFNSQEEFDSGQSLSPHKLRHTFATEWIKSNGNLILLRDQLGHNSIETTQKYTNLSSKESKKVMNEMEKTRE